MRTATAALRDSTNQRRSRRSDGASTPQTAAKPLDRGTPHTEPKAACDEPAIRGGGGPEKNLFEAPSYLLPRRESGVALTVVLDLDETLVSNRRLDLPAAILRPYALKALRALCETRGVELVLWTASTEETAAPVVRQLAGGEGGVFHHVIYRNDAWFTEPYHSKDLRLLGRPMDRVVLFDNAPNCCKMNRHNAVLVDDFSGYVNPADNTLINLYRIVETLLRHIANGHGVHSVLETLADESAVCCRVSYDLPEAWQRIDVSELHPLQVPPHGEFFKVMITGF